MDDHTGSVEERLLAKAQAFEASLLDDERALLEEALDRGAEVEGFDQQAPTPPPPPPGTGALVDAITFGLLQDRMRSATKQANQVRNLL